MFYVTLPDPPPRHWTIIELPKSIQFSSVLEANEPMVDQVTRRDFELHRYGGTNVFREI